MLTLEEYNNLWNDHFAGKNGLGVQPMPPYNEYLEAENMLEDYLDIFRGVNTRNERGNGRNEWYYEHPFFNGDTPKLTEKPCIKYIMIGEARPLPNCFDFNDCLPINGDTSNSYFYNISHINQTPWLNSPRIAWNCPPFKPCPSNKIETLLCLASKGVLLLDLFPFAIRFSTNLRTSLNNNGSTLNFWNNKSNPYNLEDRLRNINNLLCNDWDLCLVAPCKTSCFILSNGFPILVTATAGLHPTTFYDILIDPTRCVGCNDPLNCNKWRKIAIAQQGPSAHLLGSCFGL